MCMRKNQKHSKSNYIYLKFGRCCLYECFFIGLIERNSRKTPMPNNVLAGRFFLRIAMASSALKICYHSTNQMKLLKILFFKIYAFECGNLGMRYWRGVLCARPKYASPLIRRMIRQKLPPPFPLQFYIKFRLYSMEFQFDSTPIDTTSRIFMRICRRKHSLVVYIRM